MKQNKNKDISILLYTLLLFSFGMGWIYSKKSDNSNIEKSKNNNTTNNTLDNIKTCVNTGEDPSKKIESKPEPETKQIETKDKSLEKEKTPESSIKIPKLPEPPAEIQPDTEKIKKEEKLTTEDILAYSKELIESHGIDDLITILKVKCPKEIISKSINAILKQYDEDLSRQEKLKIIIALAKHYEKDKNLQDAIFNIISENKNLEFGEVESNDNINNKNNNKNKKEDTPILFIAIEVGEEKAAPNIVEWYSKSNRTDIRDIAKETLHYAAKNDYSEAIKKLYEIGVKIDSKLATELLWENLKSNKGFKSIEFLKKIGADLNSIDSSSKFTTIIQAVKNKNLALIKKLAELGASVKTSSPEKAIGSPLQVARELELIDIENYLRSLGAKY